MATTNPGLFHRRYSKHSHFASPDSSEAGRQRGAGPTRDNFQQRGRFACQILQKPATAERPDKPASNFPYLSRETELHLARQNAFRLLSNRPLTPPPHCAEAIPSLHDEGVGALPLN